MGEIYLSVVIPAYNEEIRLPRTLEEIRPYLDSKLFSYEIVITDDGSTDRTVSLCQQKARGWAQLRIVTNPHKGKGNAVKQGCLSARGDYVLIMDADHPTPIDTLDLMLPLMEDHDMVVGVRAFSGEEGASGKFRRIVGLAQQLMAHIIVFQKSVADSQCGFKLFSRDAAHTIFKRSRIEGGMYDVEIFFVAHKHNLKIYSKPVRWVNKEGSRINIPRCMIMDPLALFQIRLMDLLGKYN